MLYDTTYTDTKQTEWPQGVNNLEKTAGAVNRNVIEHRTLRTAFSVVPGSSLSKQISKIVILGENLKSRILNLWFH